MSKNAAIKALAAAGAGAGLAYLFDARSGGRRRALLRDRGFHFLRKAGKALDAWAADLAGRSQALVPAVRRVVKAERVDDAVLFERVRSRMGRLVSHPRSVVVEINNGIVTLRGPLLLWECDGLLRRIRRVPGVRGVVDRFELRMAGAGIPGLRGPSHPQ